MIPLFRQREKNKKGKGSYQRKINMQRRMDREASGKPSESLFTTGLLLSLLIKTRLFCWLSAESRISLSRTSSLEGLAVPPDLFFLRFNLFINLIAMKMANATMMKSKTF